ncbi:MAG: DUF3429 domain-containing protein [Parvularculaceae bacterium]
MSEENRIRPLQEDEITRLGFIGLIPFAVGAAGLWLSPWILPQTLALDLHVITLAYAGVIAVYLAGIGAGAKLAPRLEARGEFISGAVAVLAVWTAIWQGGVFYFSIGAVWRYLIILLVLVYLLMRDRAAVRAGLLPLWYGELRTRLTFWAGMSMVLIMSRLMLWGYY